MHQYQLFPASSSPRTSFSSPRPAPSTPTYLQSVTGSSPIVRSPLHNTHHQRSGSIPNSAASPKRPRTAQRTVYQVRSARTRSRTGPELALIPRHARFWKAMEIRIPSVTTRLYHEMLKEIYVEEGKDGVEDQAIIWPVRLDSKSTGDRGGARGGGGSGYGNGPGHKRTQALSGGKNGSVSGMTEPTLDIAQVDPSVATIQFGGDLRKNDSGRYNFSRRGRRAHPSANDLYQGTVHHEAAAELGWECMGADTPDVIDRSGRTSYYHVEIEKGNWI